jgi:hypothetical protein
LALPGGPGCECCRTGLWRHFSPASVKPYVDILGIADCSSLPNLLDKRSRFAPTTALLLAYCPLGCLLGSAPPNDATPRWRLIRMVGAEPCSR